MSVIRAGAGTRRRGRGDFRRCQRSVPVTARIASETGDLLGITTTAVNSMVRRARTRLGRAASVARDADHARDAGDAGAPADRRLRRLLDRYAAAVENADGVALTRLLRADAVLEMPPSTTWFAGRD